MTTPYQLPLQTITDYARDGAVVLRGVLTPAEVRQLTEGIEHNLAHPSPLCLVASQPMTRGALSKTFAPGRTTRRIAR